MWHGLRNGVGRGQDGPAFAPWTSRGTSNMLGSAILAASAHNTQPWRFEVDNRTIMIHADAARHIGSFDPDRREMHQSLGCALENLVQAARAEGFEAPVELPPGRLVRGDIPAGPSAIVTLLAGPRVETELYRAIPFRHTDRGPYVEREVPEGVIHAMHTAAREWPEMRLLTFTGTERAPLSKIIAYATRAIVDDAQMAEDNARWFRFRQPEVERFRDGLTLDTSVRDPMQRFLAKVFTPSAKLANRAWLRTTLRMHLRNAPLLGVIAVRDLYDRPQNILAGRLWQRLHLLLTARGLAAQPMNQPVERVDRERVLDIPRVAAAALDIITGTHWHATFVFRAGYAKSRAPASPRRALADVVR